MIKAPAFGDRGKAMLADMAVLAGGQVISEDVGLKLDGVTLDVLGRARKVVVAKDDTTIVEGAGSKADVQGRIRQIRTEIEHTDSGWDREKLQERLAKLAGGLAVIKVGAATELELKEKKHRIEDAVSATRAAIEEGIVPGGGTAFMRARQKVQALDLGRRGAWRPDRVAGHWKPLPPRSPTTPACPLGYGPRISSGRRATTKVTRAALRNAASVAGLVLTTDVLVADKPEPKAPGAGMGDDFEHPAADTRGEEVPPHGRHLLLLRPQAMRGPGPSATAWLTAAPPRPGRQGAALPARTRARCRHGIGLPPVPGQTRPPTAAYPPVAGGPEGELHSPSRVCIQSREGNRCG